MNKKQPNHLLLEGDCIAVLKDIPDNSIDAVVTDPPYGLSFMGKKWDYDVPSVEVWREVMRVLKPGGHALIACGTRTQHRMAVNIEDAGFEIRDVITWLYGSGFPKSLNIQKAGAGEQWQGWGTALKPACEFWTLARKPLSEKTVAANVLKWGTGAINIDASRINGDLSEHVRERALEKSDSVGYGTDSWQKKGTVHQQGRFPANLILSHSENCTDDACDLFDCPVKILDEQSGTSKSSGGGKKVGVKCGSIMGKVSDKDIGIEGYYGDTGGASRFFYCAKSSKSERNAGCEGLPVKKYKTGCGGDMPIDDKGSDRDRFQAQAHNIHPTVKPIKLMSYLIKMITPPNGTVLDPFCGSGSTGVAALREGFKFIGIEREPEYFVIAENRLNHENNRKPDTDKNATGLSEAS